MNSSEEFCDASALAEAKQMSWSTLNTFHNLDGAMNENNHTIKRNSVTRQINKPHASFSSSQIWTSKQAAAAIENNTPSHNHDRSRTGQNTTNQKLLSFHGPQPRIRNSTVTMKAQQSAQYSRDNIEKRQSGYNNYFVPKSLTSKDQEKKQSELLFQSPSSVPAEEEDEEENARTKILRKASVAVGGVSLIAAGIPLIPLPGPGDLMVVGGLALLATEFPIAQKVIDKGRDKLVEILADDDADADDENSVQDVMKECDNGKCKDQDKNEEICKANCHEIKCEKNTCGTYVFENDKENKFDDKTLEKEETYRTCESQRKEDNLLQKIRAPSSKEVDEAMSKATKSLKKLARGTILPAVEHFASNNDNNEINDDRKIETIEKNNKSNHQGTDRHQKENCTNAGKTKIFDKYMRSFHI